jgi:hypothetical protein
VPFRNDFNCAEEALSFRSTVPAGEATLSSISRSEIVARLGNPSHRRADGAANPAFWSRNSLTCFVPLLAEYSCGQALSLFQIDVHDWIQE